MRLRCLILLVISFALPLFGLTFVLRGAPISAAGCSITVFWRWTDGKDYSIPPSPAIVGDTVKAIAQFNNCNLGGNKAYFTLISPGLLYGTNEEVRNLNSLGASQAFRQDFVDFKFNTSGQHRFKATVEAGGQIFEETSQPANVNRAGDCNFTLNFDANPKQVSTSQLITLTSIVSKPSQNCTSYSYNIEFYHASSKLISSVQVNSSLPRQETRSITSKASDLGYKSGDNIQFVSKVRGTGYGSGGSRAERVDLISTPVNIGVDRPPATLAKYSCRNNACAQDPNGQYGSLEICQKQCGTGAGGGAGEGSGTTGGETGGDEGGDREGGELPGYDLTIRGVGNIITGIACWLIGVIFAVMIIALVVAGVRFFLASGDPTKIGAARKNLLWVVIGIAVIIATNIIIATIAGFLGADYSLLPLKCGSPIGCVDDKQCVERNGPGHRCVPPAEEEKDPQKRQCVGAEVIP